MTPRAHSARYWAWELIVQVWRDGAYANLVWPTLLRESPLSPADKRLATEIGYGALRHWGQLEKIIERAAKRPWDTLDPPTQALLAVGAQQLLHMRVAPHAAVNETVALTGHAALRKVQGLANAVLRRVSERTVEQWLELITAGAQSDDEVLALRHAHPQWVVRALRRALAREGREVELEQALQANNDPAAVTLVALPGLAAVESGDQATEYSPLGFLRPGDPAEDPRVAMATARVQDEGSQLAALVAAAGLTAGAEVLDACAGPGGKAAVLGAIALTEGATLTALDRSAHRAHLVRQSLAGVLARGAGVDVHVADTRDYLLRNPERRFDRILLDAPCSGLGALRRRPEARWRKSEEDLSELTLLQRSLALACFDALAEDGLMVYVTCSPLPEETDEVVAWVLAQRPQAHLRVTGDILDSVSKMPVAHSRVGHAVQLWPHRHHTDAMFIQAIGRTPRH